MGERSGKFRSGQGPNGIPDGEVRNALRGWGVLVKDPDDQIRIDPTTGGRYKVVKGVLDAANIVRSGSTVHTPGSLGIKK